MRKNKPNKESTTSTPTSFSANLPKEIWTLILLQSNLLDLFTSHKKINRDCWKLCTSDAFMSLYFAKVSDLKLLPSQSKELYLRYLFQKEITKALREAMAIAFPIKPEIAEKIKAYTESKKNSWTPSFLTSDTMPITIEELLYALYAKDPAVSKMAFHFNVNNTLFSLTLPDRIEKKHPYHSAFKKNAL